MTRRQLALSLALLSLIQAAALAGADKTWTISGPKGLSNGKLSGVSVLSTGEMVLGPKVEKVEGIEGEYVWDIEAGAEGEFYVATGSPAAVYVLRDGKVSLLHKASQKHMLSVLPLRDGSVLAAATPGGIVYRINAAGSVTVLKALGEMYVWDMALGPNGEVYCATGPEVKLLRLNASGEVEEIVNAQQGHMMSLAVDEETGAIFCGTAPAGLVYKIEPDGALAVLYDTGKGEVRCLVRTPDGVLYAGAARAEGQSLPAAATNTESSPGEPPSGTAQGGASMLPGKPGEANGVYMITPGKGGMELLQLPDALVLSLAMTGEGALAVGTGPKGRLFGVNTDGISRSIMDFDAQHVSAMASDGKGTLLLGTSNAGGIWTLTAGHRESGTFTSEVFDAALLSRWGRLQWRGSAPPAAGAAVSLRTGNVREPGDTWSAWSDPVEHAAGAQLAVPMGRFAQVRVTLTTSDRAVTPALIEVATSYRQANRRPRVLTVSVDGAKAEGGTSDNMPEPGSRPERAGKRKITWKASDPNSDPLVFELYYRAVDERQWKRMHKEPITETSHSWETTRVPDGRYLIRVVASDRAGRGPDEALEGEKVTAPIVIDSGRPDTLDLQAARQDDGSYLITGIAKDTYSNIAAVQASHNAERWKPVFASDGIFDSTAEEFAFRTEILEEGEHVFVFAAMDAAGNTGGQKIVIEVQ